MPKPTNRLYATIAIWAAVAIVLMAVLLNLLIEPKDHDRVAIWLIVGLSLSAGVSTAIIWWNSDS